MLLHLLGDPSIVSYSLFSILTFIQVTEDIAMCIIRIFYHSNKQLPVSVLKRLAKLEIRNEVRGTLFCHLFIPFFRAIPIYYLGVILSLGIVFKPIYVLLGFSTFSSHLVHLFANCEMGFEYFVFIIC